MSRGDVTSVAVHHVFNLHDGCPGGRALPSNRVAATSTDDDTRCHDNVIFLVVCGASRLSDYIHTIQHHRVTPRQCHVQFVYERYTLRLPCNARRRGVMCIVHYSTSKCDLQLVL